MSTSEVTLEGFLIPLKEINLATRDLISPETHIGNGGFGAVYRGKLSESWQNCTAAFKLLHPDRYKGENDFHIEVEMISSFNHENIIPFIGYYHEDNMMIIASEYAINGSLDHHLQDRNKRRCLTWPQRLKICIGAAKGLEYLHSGLGEGRKIIHKNIKGATILLDGNFEAKITLSKGPISQIVRIMTTFDVGSSCYMDPNYNERGILNEESDVYSLGVVLFEILSGMLAHDTRIIEDQKPQTLMNLVRIYYDDGLEKLIDPLIRNQIDDRSFRIFKEVACQCITFRSKDRPKMDNIIQRIEEALDVQIQGAPSTSATIQINQYHELERFLIPLKDINSATKDFSPKTCIGVHGYGEVYKGQISEHKENRTIAFDRMYSSLGVHLFHTEVEMMSSFNHENIIAFVGYCDEDNEHIIVSEYVVNKSLEYYLKDPNEIRCITWAQRLKICLGVARGLKYLHSGLGEHNIVIHRDIKSANILLDENLDAKICGFVLSILVDRNKPQVYEPAAGTPFYLDPIYYESGIVKTELDIYSFGVVLFEMFDWDLGLHIHSFQVFKAIAYRCISLNLKDRPTMNMIIKRIEEALDNQNPGPASIITTPRKECQNLENFLIPLKEIYLATQYFSVETQIGDGGFGVIYKGQLSEHRQKCIVAIKRLDQNGYQGRKEFLTELKLISSFHHKNIIRFIGYCDEGNEMVIVSEYASNGSLDHHLEDPNKRCCLTWAQRLQICLGAARGLNYLHSGLGEDNRVIHRDIKSANILLDENLEVKVCDFGLSKQGPRDPQPTHLYTKAAGTNFYLDLIYQESGILRKESDVYSFGVVLFEILSGMMAFNHRSLENDRPQPLINLIRRYYNDRLEELIDPFIKDEIDRRCFQTFKELAYQCISYNSKERPTMEAIIERIEDAIYFQGNSSNRLF
ncbi:unnamed protein product [Lactuca saligna]|uniref:non-specific serine/threonine protein kinase n=1 Tax=Lactuca saligna TaxID=75948 RepID=A0AA35VA49_LACSI|nr:unnamed protein product [Lactuca saligna]